MSKRNQHGHSFSQVGPVLFLIFFLIFFPLLNLAGMALSYGVALFYNDLELRELAVSNIKGCGASPTNSSSDGGKVHQLVSADFAKTGLASFLFHGTPSAENIKSHVTFAAPKDFLAQASVTDETTFWNVPPFVRVSLPFVQGISGLDANYNVVVRQTRTREELR